jgi:HK97 family phage major capsid protein
LSVIGTATTDSDVVEYLEETTYTNNASPTAEASDAPESAVAFTKRTDNVREITHFIPVTRRALADQAFLQDWLNNRLVDGVRRRLQQQVLTGAGTTQDLEGIYTNSSIGSVDRSNASVTMLDSIAKCITTIRTSAFREPDFVGIHPNDYETLVLNRADAVSASDRAGDYLYGNPITGGPRTIWGVPAIVHTAFTSGTPLVGVGNEAVLFVRSGVEVAASDSHSDYFIKRQVALLATMRAAFGVITPGAFCKSVA